MEGLRERTRCHACRNCSGACWPNQMRQCFNVNQGSLRTRDLPVTRHVTSPSLHDGITDLGSRAGGAVRGGQGQPGAAKKGPGPRLRSRNERSCAKRTLQAETHPAFCTELRKTCLTCEKNETSRLQSVAFLRLSWHRIPANDCEQRPFRSWRGVGHYVVPLFCSCRPGAAAARAASFPVDRDLGSEVTGSRCYYCVHV